MSNKEKERVRQAAYYAAHRAERRLYVAAHRVERHAQRAAYRASHREEDRAYNRKRRYGLTPTVYEEMVATQAGLCAICGENKSLVVDHSHLTRNVRGLLCHRCNTMLGGLEDEEWTSKANAYLAKS